MSPKKVAGVLVEATADANGAEHARIGLRVACCIEKHKDIMCFKNDFAVSISRHRSTALLVTAADATYNFGTGRMLYFPRVRSLMSICF